MKTGLDLLDRNSASVIFSFMRFNDAINLCYSSKKCYANYITTCYRFSFISINLNKRGKKTISGGGHKGCPGRADHEDFSMFGIFSQFPQVPQADMFNYIKYVKYLNNVNSISFISDIMPQKLKSISFGKTFNAPWDKNILPDTVETIIFHDKSKFDYNLSRINLPANLKHIYFGKAFNKPIDDLPPTLEKIFFCKNSKFDRYIKTYPRALTEIDFGLNYNRPIKGLPTSVKILRFVNTSKFNEEIEYPVSLERIFYGKFFNRNIDALLRNCPIQTIRFHDKSIFNCPIAAHSRTLTHLYIGAEFDQHLDLSQFSALKLLRFYKKSKFGNVLILPHSIEKIQLGKRFKSIKVQESVE